MAKSNGNTSSLTRARRQSLQLGPAREHRLGPAAGAAGLSPRCDAGHRYGGDCAGDFDRTLMLTMIDTAFDEIEVAAQADVQRGA